MSRIELTGRKFGKWTVIRYIGGTRVLWECVCECGKKASVGGQNLRLGGSTQCKSCSLIVRHKRNRASIVGKRFGKWTVLKAKPGKLECRCDCGVIRWVNLTSIKIGTSKQCMRCGISPRLEPTEAAFRQVLNCYVCQARKSGREWNLSNEQVKSLFKDNCFYCGKAPNEEPITGKSVRYSHRGLFIYNGIDRVDNSRGYMMSNVVTCCSLCNLAKRDLDYNVFMAWLNRVKSHPGSTKIHWEYQRANTTRAN